MDDLLNIDQAADKLNTNVRHLRALTYRKEMPYVKIGHLVRYERSALLKYIEDHRVDAQP
ncbi:MAG: helix-turn-helix domain-containing protein [Acidimicrobiaceae bacterium]|jgi:excisionase family DNA binding protein|nr:helix-turn-helix domain-containing protein [Acidimicrobiaceae bacterium]